MPIEQEGPAAPLPTRPVLPAPRPGGGPVPWRAMARVLSGVQPSGDLHLGNYLGAFRSWVADQHEYDALFCVVDLHALTSEYDPAVLAAKTLETARSLLAVGLDPAA